MQKQRLHKYYKNVVIEDLLLLYNCSSIMQIPLIEHVKVSTTSKSYLLDKRGAIPPFAACYLLSGQKSVPTRAHKSIAAFKLRENSLIGCMVTLRGDKMYQLLDKLISFILPRMYDYRGNRVGSSKRQNYINMGVNNLLSLPEIEPFFELFEPIQGINIVFLFSVPQTRAILTGVRPKKTKMLHSGKSIERRVANVAMEVSQTIHQGGAKNVHSVPQRSCGQTPSGNRLGGASLLSSFQYPKV